MNGPAGEQKAKWGAAGAFLLLLVVAAAAGVSGGRAASRGASSGSSGGLGMPNWAGSIVVGLVAGAGAIFAFGLIAGLLRGRGRRRFVIKKWPWWYWPLLVAVAAATSALLLLLFGLLAHGKEHLLTPPQLGSRLGHLGSLPPAGATGAKQALSWEPFAVGAAVALATALAYVLFNRRRAGRAVFSKPLQEREALQQRQRDAVAAIDESLDALWAEPDPRKAVIAAYARMDSWLARAGFARRASEAPFEHLDRVVGGLGATAAIGAALADLFERAKFDRRPCGPDMKQSALGALTKLRDELAAAALLPALSRP